MQEALLEALRREWLGVKWFGYQAVESDHKERLSVLCRVITIMYHP